MPSNAVIVSLVAIAISLISTGAWARAAYRVAIPDNRTVFLFSWTLSAVLGAASFYTAGATVTSQVLGAVAAILGLLMLILCTDTPKQIASGRKKHGLTGTILADPTLAVTDFFGLRNHNIAVRPPGLAGLPVPTSLLVSAAGVVLWKDQSPDYVQRSDPEYLRKALRTHF